MDKITQNKLEKFADLIEGIQNIMPVPWFRTGRIVVHLHVQVDDQQDDND